jgi:hypothetical protein
VWARQVLQRGDLQGSADLATQRGTSREAYNTHQAHPYRWTDTGQPLGRAWLSPSPTILNGLAISPDHTSVQPLHW